MSFTTAHTVRRTAGRLTLTGLQRLDEEWERQTWRQRSLIDAHVTTSGTCGTIECHRSTWHHKQTRPAVRRAAGLTLRRHILHPFVISSLPVMSASTHPHVIDETASYQSRDSITDIFGPRTPHSGDWPVRVDSRVTAEPDHWVQSACVMCSNGCGLDIGVKDGRIVGVRGRKDDRVNRGRLGPKGLHSWVANHSADRLTQPLIRKDGQLVPASWDAAMQLLVDRTRDIQQRLSVHGMGIYTTGQTSSQTMQRSRQPPQHAADLQCLLPARSASVHLTAGSCSWRSITRWPSSARPACPRCTWTAIRVSAQRVRRQRCARASAATVSPAATPTST